VTVCPVADPFITPAQGPPISPITREADTLRVEIQLAGTVPPPGLRVWSLELAFDPTKLLYVRTERSPFTNATDWPQFSGLVPSGTGDRVWIQAAVWDQGPAPPGDPEALAVVVFAVLDNQELGPAEFGTLNLMDDFGTEPQFLQLDVAPCPFSLTFDNRGTGDVRDNDRLTPGDALCAQKCATNFDVMPNDCVTSTPPPPNESNLAPIERYEADVDCDGYVTSLDADVIFDAYFCSAPPAPCLATTDPCAQPRPPVIAGMYRAFATDKALRLGSITKTGEGHSRVPLEVRGSGTLAAFGLDFAYSGFELLAVEPSTLTRSWTQFSHDDIAPAGVRIGAYDLEGIVLSQDRWTTLGYALFRATPEQLAADSEPLRLAGSVDDLEGVALLPWTPGELSLDPDHFSLGAAQPNPTNGFTSVRYVVPSGAAATVTIRIFNVRGQVVRTLVDGPHAAGEHAADWDGRDGSGSTVAAGGYFYRMQAGSFSQTRKFIVSR
jgi:hypothetical protein